MIFSRTHLNLPFFLIGITTFLVFGGFFAFSRATDTITVTVDKRAPLRLWLGFGATLYDNGTEKEPFGDALDYAIDDLNLDIWGITTPMKFEQGNDNSDPFVAQSDKFSLTSVALVDASRDGVFQRRHEVNINPKIYKEIVARGGNNFFYPHSWGYDTWLVKGGNPYKREPNWLDGSKAQEFAEWWLELVKKLEAETGINVRMIGVSVEPDSGDFYPTATRATPQDLKEIILAVIQRFKREGRDEKVAFPETSHDPLGERRYFDLLNDPQFSPLFKEKGYVVYREYNIWNPDSRDFVGSFTQKGFITGHGEFSWVEAPGKNDPEFVKNWDFDKGLALAERIYLSLSVAKNSFWLWWELWRPNLPQPCWNNRECGQALMNVTDSLSVIELLPKYYAFRQFSRYTSTGWQLVSVSEISGLKVLAWASPDNHDVTLVIINNTSNDKNVQVELSSDRFSSRVTKMIYARDNFNAPPFFYNTQNGKIVDQIPAHSIVTYTTLLPHQRALPDFSLLESSFLSPDINNDGKINVIDLGIVFSFWGKEYIKADLSRNGKVDAQDIGVLFQKWNP